MRASDNSRGSPSFSEILSTLEQFSDFRERHQGEEKALAETRQLPELR
jgi:hypothetical protein